MLITSALKASCELQLLGNATAQPDTLKRATGNATTTQLKETKPMSLLALARNKLRNCNANAPQKGTQLTPQVEALRADAVQPCWSWMLFYANREPMQAWFSPEATSDEVLDWFPDAVAAQPFLMEDV